MKIVRKTDAFGSSNVIDTVPSTKAYEMIAELHLNEDQLRENGYPRPGKKAGMATILKPQSRPATNNEMDRYCRRCGKLYRLDHYDEEHVDQCNYHPKSPGFRRGTFLQLSYFSASQPTVGLAN